MEHVGHRIGNLSDEQLKVLTAIFMGLTAVSLFVTLAFFVVLEGGNPPPQNTLVVGGTTTLQSLPPTWTPMPPTATRTKTATPTIPTVSPTEPLPTEAALVETPLATITPETTVPEGSPEEGARSTVVPTRLIPTVVPPPPLPTVASSVPTALPQPTVVLAPSPTPVPLYILRSMEGGSGCDGVRVFGRTYDAAGLLLPGVTIKMYNDYGWVQTVVSDRAGSYEFYIQAAPGPEVAGNWHWEVLENGATMSPIISYFMTGRCNDGPHLFKLEWQKTS